MWNEVRLCELGEVSRGRSRHRPRNAPHLYGGPYPFIQTGDIKAAQGLLTSHSQTYSEAGLAQSRLWPEGTMVVTIAANIAETAILKYPACFPDSVVGFIADSSKADVRFIEYLFRHLKQKIQHENVGTGSVQDNINLKTFDRLTLCIPYLSEQRKIASVLGALDDKIELNRRMSETLEAMAQAIFKDWFVDFGPTRAKAEGRSAYFAQEIWDLFPDALDEEGKPVGWRVSVLGDRIEILDSKRIPLSSRERKKREGPYPYHGATGVMDYVDDFLFDGVHVLVGEDGSVVKPNGRPFTQYVWGKFWVNNHAHVLRGNGISNETLLCFLQQSDITPFVTGAVQAKLNQRNLKSIPIPASDSDATMAFGSLVEPLFEQIRLNSEQSRTLAQTRDLLLPKLMSGEIRVADGEKAIEAIV